MVINKIFIKKHIHIASIITIILGALSGIFEYQMAHKINAVQIQLKIELNKEISDINKNAYKFYNKLNDLDKKMNYIYSSTHIKMEDSYLNKHPVEVELGNKNIKAEMVF